MEQKFGKNSIDIEALREFCEREGEAVSYRKGDQMEREGDPSRWFGYVTDGCCYVVVPASCITLPCRTSPLFCVTPNYLSTIRKDITFEAEK